MRDPALTRPVPAMAAAVAIALVALVSADCADVSRGLGDACIRNQDCLSGVCAGQQCVAAPVLTDASTPVEASSDASSVLDGAVTSDASPPPDATDAGTTPDDASKDAVSDAPVTKDASDASATSDAPAPSDGSTVTDAPVDAGSGDAASVPPDAASDGPSDGTID